MNFLTLVSIMIVGVSILVPTLYVAGITSVETTRYVSIVVGTIAIAIAFVEHKFRK